MASPARDLALVDASRAPRVAALSRPRVASVAVLALSSAIGIAVMALAVAAARIDAPWQEVPFWLGLLFVFVPPAWRVLSPAPTRGERIGALAALALGLYLVKVVRNPLGFTPYDEFIHWRTALDIVRSGHLFGENPLLAVSPLYPGLEIVTTSLSQLGGLTLFQAALAVIGLGRLVLVLALFLFYEEISSSPRIAGIATLVYMANPSFTFFDSQFGYESLALSFAAVALLLVARLQRGAGQRESFALGVLLAAALGALAVTHHLTSFATTAILLAWAGLSRWRGIPARAPLAAGAAAAAFNAIWLAAVAGVTLTYLAAPIARGISELARLVSGESIPREPFRSASGAVAPLPERLAGYGSVALTLAVLPPGLRLSWAHHRDKPVALVLAALALAYPLTLPLRLTTAVGAEVSGRAAEFLFIGVAFVAALALDAILSSPRSRAARALATSAIAVVFIGGVVVGLAPWLRLPGPYLVAADARSIDAEGVAAAQWALRELGPDNRIVADRTNRLLMTLYGDQRPVTLYGDGVNTAALVLDPNVGDYERSLIARGRVRYLVVDRRLGLATPTLTYYFESGEPDEGHHLVPVSGVALQKFDSVPNASRVFDSGNIVVYEFGAGSVR